MIPNVGIVDFYLPEKNIIIECDGKHWHNKPEQKVRDKYRIKKLSQLGYIILRFNGNDIKKNLKKCLNIIKEAK